MKFSEIKEHNYFNKGQIVSCVTNDRGENRAPVNLTNGKLYTVIDNHENAQYGLPDKFGIWVMNDGGIIEKYSSKRFKIDRNAIISNLLK